MFHLRSESSFGSTPHSSAVSMHNKRQLSRLIGLTLVSFLTACGYSNLTASEDLSNPVSLPEASVVVGDDQADESSSPVYFGVLAIDSALSVHDRYSLLMNYLSQAVGQPFELVVLNQDSQFAEAASANLDFITSNPLASVQIQRLYKTEFLTTLERPKTGSQFGGLIITRSDSEIQTLADLRDKRVACVDFETAAAGCLFQIYHLLQNKIDPFQSFSQFIENPSQDNIVLGVLNRTIDAGFIRTGQLERMVKSGLIDSIEEIKILAPRTTDFFFTHTTDLYPEWPIAALSQTDSDLVASVQAALLAIPDHHPALSAANLTGFNTAENYQPLHELIETLKLKSWDAQ